MRKSISSSLLVAFVIFSLLGVLNAQSLTPSPTGTWSLTGAMSQARSGAAAVAMNGGAVLVTGGTDASGVVLATAEIYGSKGAFTVVAPMNVPRTGHTATWLANGSGGSSGYVLVTGGASTGGVILASAELYDPTANTWTLLPSPMVVARTGHPATALPNSSVLLSGGTSGSVSSPVVIADLEQFGLTNQQFVYAGALSTARKAHAAAALLDGRVLIVGGTDGNGNTLASSAIYDPVAGTISSGPSLNTPRANATATTLLDGTVLIAAGRYPEGAAANGGIAELGSAEIYDPVAGTITPVAGNLVQARAGHQAFLLPNNNNVLLVGGTYNGSDLASSELYTPWKATFTATGMMSTPRSSASGAALFPMADGQLLVAGGSNQQTDGSGAVTTTTSGTSELYGFATIETDATDYSPGTPVIMSGTGWKPSENVSLYMQAFPQSADVPPVMTTVADANGNILDGAWAPDTTDLNARFYLTAVGATSGAQAQNTFTDHYSSGNITIGVSPAAASNSIGLVDSGGATFTPASCTAASCSPTFTGTISSGDTITFTATPGTGYQFSSWTYSYATAPTPATCTNGGTTNPCYVTVPSGSGNTVSVTANFTLVPATKLAFTTSAVTVTAGSCSSIITVQTQTSGSVGANPSSTETVALSSTAGAAGTYYSNSTCTTAITSLSIPTTANSASFYFKDTTGGAPVITASGTGAFASAPTQTETVDQAPTITSATSTTFTVGTAGSFTVTASGYPASSFTETGTLPSGVTLSTAGVLSGTPAAGSGGSYPITITAADGTTPNATQSFTLTVNQAPAITSVASAAFVANTAGSFTVTASGYPAPTFSETGTLPSGVTLNSTTGVLSGTATTTGSYAITITASNGTTPNATQSFTLTVGQAPTITSANNTAFTVGTAGSFTVTASGYPTAMTYSETGALPTGVTFTGGVLSGTPAAGTGGSYAITITASNGITPAGTQSFTLTVKQAPAITSTASTTFTVNTAGTFTVTASGYPAPTFTETGTLPSGVTLSSAGVLSGTPTATGSFPITITASNGVGTNATQSFTLTVGQAPAITSANNTAFTVSTAGSFTVTASGFPAPTFTETGTLPGGVTLSTAGVLSGTPTATGSFPITITASNGVGTNATQSFTLTVNQAPTITSASSTAFTVGTAGSFTFTASGYPATMTYSETGALPSGVTLSSAGVLSGTPGAATGGSYPITVTASNGITPAGTQSFTLTVNQVPAFTSGTSTTFTVGTAGSFQATASGYPAPTFTETGTLPSGVTLSTAGLLSGTPAAGTGGSYPITLKATNTAGAPTQSFTLTVNQSAAITSATSTSFVVGTAGTFTVTATGTPTPTLSESGTLPSGVTFNATTGVLSGTPAAGSSGSYPITFTATNGVGTAAQQSFTLTVNQAPAFTSGTSTTFTVGTAGTFTVTASGTPAPTITTSSTLPSGVTFTSATGVLAGTPAAGSGKVYSITFTASNGVGTAATQTFTLTVNEKPTVTSATSTSFTAGSAGTFTVTATGYPAPTFSETGTLPSGVSLNSTSGVLSGTAATGGAYPITITASNSQGTGTQAFTLNVNQTTAITTQPASPTVVAGQSTTLTAAASGYPTPTVQWQSCSFYFIACFSWSNISGATSPTYTIANPVTTSSPYYLQAVFTNSGGSATTNMSTVTVNTDTTTSLVTSSLNPSNSGQSVTFTDTVTASAPSTGIPTGTVTFKDGTTTLGTGTLNGSGVATYTTTTLAVGSHSITAAYGADSNYTASTSPTLTQTVNLPPTITSGTSTTFTVGTAGSFTVTATGTPAPTFTETGTLPSGVTLSSAGALSGTPTTAGSYPITITATNVAGTNNQSFTLTVSKGTPTVSTWPTASQIAYGQTLASSTLSGGSASVGGGYAFTTPGTTPGLGTATQSVTFTPTDTADWNTVTGSVNVTVIKATPTITTLPTASPITYGQTLASSTLSGGSASVAGGFTFTTPSTAPGAGTYAASVTFTPTNTTDYNTVTTTVNVSVAKATPTVSAWPTASTISYGQTLASSNLSGGTASVGGGFAFTTPTTAPGAGTASQSVTFTPTDATDYNTVAGTVSVTVTKAAPTVSAWPTASTITYGQTLASSALSGGTASVGGGFAFTTPTTAPGAGTASQSVTFTPTDTTDYSSVTGSVSVTVSKATPTVSIWPTAGAITYGQTLASSALSGGTASVGGGFAFTTPTTAPGAGTASQSVTFTPTDATDYNSVTGSTSVTVNKATPTVSAWPTASTITYGQTLASSSLSGGTASVGGGFAFTTPTTAPGAGTASQSVTFTPTDTTDYNSVTGSTSVTVNKATPTVSAWPTAGAITYGQTLASSALSGGTASVGGGFAFTAPTTAPGAGTASQSVTFTPTDAADNNSVTGSVSVTVNKANASVTLSGLNQTYDGAQEPVTATTNPTGLTVTFTYNGSPTAPTTAGSYTVVGTISDANYQGSATGTLVITQALATVTLSNLTQTYSGSPEAASVSTQPTGLVVVPSYAGISVSYGSTTTPPTNPGTYTVTASVVDPNYTGFASGTLTINQLSAALNLALMAGMPEPSQYGTMVYFQLAMATTPCPTGTVQFNVDGSLASTVTLTGSSCTLPVQYQTATLTPGSHTVTAVYSGDTYYAGATSGTVTHAVVADTTAVTLAVSGQSVNVGQPVTFTATVTPSPEDASAQAPTGSVQFFDSGVQIGSNTLTTSAPYTAGFTTSALAAGSHSIMATYVTANGLYAGSSSAVTVETVNKIAPVIAWPNPADIAYGTQLGSTQLNATASDGNGNTVNGTFAYNPVANTVLPVGQINLSVTFAPDDPATYTNQTATATINVTAAPLTVTADSLSRVYGTDNPTFTYQIAGFVNNDTVATATTGLPALSSLAVASSPVNSYPITVAAGTLVAPNYTITYAPGTLTVKPAALTVQADNATRAYGVANPTLSGTLSGLVTGDNITASFSTTATVSSAVGTYPITATLSDPGNALGNYTVTKTPGTLTITQVALTVTADAKSKVYGSGDPALTYVSVGLVNGDQLSGSLTRTAGENVGSYAILQGTLAASGNYTISYVPANLTITAASALVTPNGGTKVYGATDPTFTGTLSGFLPTDGVSATYTRTAGESVAGGPYVISAKLSPTGVLGNYNITYNTAQFTITAANASVTPSAATKVYGTTDPGLGGTLSGFLPADGVSATYTRTAGENVAGSPYLISATLNPAGALGNYNITYNTAPFTITQATALVTLSNLTQTYSGSPEPASVSTTPTGLGLTFSYTGIAPTSYASNATPPTNPGSYALVATVFDPNYIGQGSGALTINQLDPALNLALLTGMPEPSPYGTMVYYELAMATTPCPTGSVQFYVDTQATGSAVVLSGSNCANPVQFQTATLTPGPHSVYAIYSGDTFYAGNTSGTVTHTVTADSTAVTLATSGTTVNVGSPISFTATVTPTSLDPSAQAPAGTVQFNDGGVQIGATALSATSPYTASYTTSALAAGSHSISATYVNSNGLFAGSSSAVTVETVNKIAPVITWANPADIAYGTQLGSTQLNATATDGNGNAVNGTFNYNPAIGAMLAVGQLNLTVTFTPDDTATYSNQSASATINVNPVVLTVTADSLSRGYGAANPTFTYQVTGFVNGESTSIVTGQAALNTTATSSSAVGSYPITVVAGTLAAPNYSFQFVNGTLTVNPTQLTVTVANANKPYGAANPVFAGTLTGLVTGDNINASFSTTATVSSAVGSYPITATLNDPGNALGNYTVSNTPGTLTVTQAALTITADTKSKVYGTGDPALTYTSAGLVNGDQLSGTLTRAADESVGSYPIQQGTLTASGNYTITYVPANLTVTPAPAWVTPAAAGKVYGVIDPVLAGTSGGFLSSDNVTVTYKRVVGEGVGAYTISATLSPANVLGNYNITYNTAQFTITQAPLAVGVQPATKAYGSANPTFTPTYAGFVNGDAAAALAGTLTFTTSATASSGVGSYAVTPGGVTSANYSISFTPGTLTVTSSALSIGVQPAAKTYGSPNPTFTPTYGGFVNGDTAASLTGTLVLTTSATASSGVGTYAVTPSGVTSANYSITFVPGTLTVGSAQLTVTATNLSRNYNAANPALTYAVTGFVNGDSNSVVSGAASCTTTAVTLSPVGTYPITCTQGTLAAGNYTFSFVAGSLSIVGVDFTESNVILTGTPVSGGTVQETDTTSNIGAIAAAGSSTYLYLSTSPTSAGYYLSARIVPALAVNGTSTGTTTLTLPPGMMGTYYIVACANGNNAVPESNQTNNCSASASFTVVGPDLTESGVTVTGTTDSGAPIQVTDTVTDTGGEAGGSTTYFYLSPTPTSAGTYLGSRNVPVIASNGKSTATTSLTLPSGLSGTYYLVACANGNGLATESNLTNNCSASTAINVVYLPDLTESSVTVAGTIANGASVQVTDVTTDLGAAAGGSTTYIYLSMNPTTTGSYLGGHGVGPLATNGSYSATTTVKLPTGMAVNSKYYLVACANANNQVAESSTTNNCSGVAIVVTH